MYTMYNSSSLTVGTCSKIGRLEATIDHAGAHTARWWRKSSRPVEKYERCGNASPRLWSCSRGLETHPVHFYSLMLYLTCSVPNSRVIIVLPSLTLYVLRLNISCACVKLLSLKCIIAHIVFTVLLINFYSRSYEISVWDIFRSQVAEHVIHRLMALHKGCI